MTTRFSPPTYADRWPDGMPESRLVVIGRGLDRDAILTGFAECLTDGAIVFDRSRGAV
jgi:G3E family GTPase